MEAKPTLEPCHVPLTELESIYLSHLINTRSPTNILLCLAEQYEAEAQLKGQLPEIKAICLQTAAGLREIVKQATSGQETKEEEAKPEVKQEAT